MRNNVGFGACSNITFKLYHPTLHYTTLHYTTLQTYYTYATHTKSHCSVVQCTTQSNSTNNESFCIIWEQRQRGQQCGVVQCSAVQDTIQQYQQWGSFCIIKQSGPCNVQYNVVQVSVVQCCVQNFFVQTLLDETYSSKLFTYTYVFTGKGEAGNHLPLNIPATWPELLHYDFYAFVSLFFYCPFTPCSYPVYHRPINTPYFYVW